MDDVKVIQSEDNMMYISPIKFLQWMFSNMNNCNEWNTQETNIEYITFQSWPRGGLSSKPVLPTTRNLTAPPPPKMDLAS